MPKNRASFSRYHLTINHLQITPKPPLHIPARHFELYRLRHSERSCLCHSDQIPVCRPSAATPCHFDQAQRVEKSPSRQRLCHSERSEGIYSQKEQISSCPTLRTRHARPDQASLLSVIHNSLIICGITKKGCRKIEHPFRAII